MPAASGDLKAGRTITCPTMIIWGAEFLGKGRESPVDCWRRTFAPEATGVEVPKERFVTEESRREALAALRDLMAR